MARTESDDESHATDCEGDGTVNALASQGTLLAALFAREGAPWNEVERTLAKIFADERHPHARSLRLLLAEHGYTQPRSTVHGMGLADAMRAAEERLERRNQERNADR